MKIGIDIGHNVIHDGGAVGYKHEDDLNLEIGTLVIKKLKERKFEVVNCTPKTADNTIDALFRRCKTANDAKCDLFVSIHHNAGGGTGSEVFYMSKMGFDYAENILKNLEALGYKNRGAKQTSHLFVLRNTVMPSILVECCFVDSSDDIKRYNAEFISNAIVLGILKTNSIEDKKIDTSTNAYILQHNLNRLDIVDSNKNKLVEDGILGKLTISAIKNFQAALDLKVTGVFDEQTKLAMDSILLKPLCSVNKYERIPTMYIQYRLNVGRSGIFDNETKDKVRTFQSYNSLVQDGIVGNDTWSRLIEE